MLERDDRVNWSTLKYLWSGSPRHYRNILRHPREDSEALLLGRAIHCAVYEEDRFDDRYAVMPKFHGGMKLENALERGYAGGKREKEEWLVAHPDAEIISDEMMERIDGMAASLTSDPVAAPLLEGGRAEVPVEWIDLETGIECRGRIDHINGRLSDLKSTRDISPRAFRNSIARYGYHAQLAFYADGLENNGEMLTHRPAIIAVESSRPFDVAVFEFSEEDMAVGRRIYREALQRLAECRATDQWPGVAGGVALPVALPAWAKPQPEPITMGGEVIL